MIATALLFSLAAASPAHADSSPHGDAEEEDSWREKPNVLSLIVAGTSDDDENAFTAGLDFERRIHRFLGVGAIVEYATDDIDAFTLLGVADIHLWRGLGIQTGPGVEFVGEEEKEDGQTTSVNRREFVYRTGVFYEFDVGEFIVTPQVHYDYTTGKDALIYGVGFGFKF